MVNVPGAVRNETRYSAIVAALVFSAGVLVTRACPAADKAAPVEWVDATTPRASDINDAFSRVMNADPDLGRAVADLESATNAAGRPWGAAQLLAAAYDVVGRYEDARQIRNDYRKTIPPCVPTGRVWPEALDELPAAVKVLLVNEDHLDVTTRANLLAALPILRRKGFTALALEAIPDVETSRMLASGDVPDDGKTGTYLREPIDALLIRQARHLGFRLESYDADDEFDTREAGQASRLAAIANRMQGKLAVFAGPGHVQLDGGWMGEHLEKQLGKRLYTIDQVSNVGADCGVGDRARLTVRDRKQKGHLPGMNTDAVLVTPAPAEAGQERTSADSWLRLGSLRVPLRVATTQLCPGTPKRCLIEARKQGEPAHTVPADRYLAGGSWQGYLFVTPGTYTVRGVDEHGSGREVTWTAAP